MQILWRAASALLQSPTSLLNRLGTASGESCLCSARSGGGSRSSQVFSPRATVLRLRPSLCGLPCEISDDELSLSLCLNGATPATGLQPTLLSAIWAELGLGDRTGADRQGQALLLHIFQANTSAASGQLPGATC